MRLAAGDSCWRDVDATIELADPEVVWHPVLEETVEGRPYRGHAGLRQYYEDLSEQGVESQEELSEYRDLGDQVLGSGSPFFQVRGGCRAGFGGRMNLEMEGGKCVEARTWLSHAETLDATGPRE